MPALSSHQVTAVTNKVNRLLTLSRVTLGRARLSWFGNSREIRAGAKHASNVGRTLPVVPDDKPLAGTVGSPEFLRLRITVLRTLWRQDKVSLEWSTKITP